MQVFETGSNPGGPTKYLKDLQTVEPSEVAFWSPTGVQFARLRARPAIRERHVAALPIGVGSRESQAVFLRENEEFTREYPRLHDLSTRIFIRGLPLPDEQEVERLRMLPEEFGVLLRPCTNREVFPSCAQSTIARLCAIDRLRTVGRLLAF
jgi:hypothetical protein